jgi:hypothetical protein
MRPNEAGGVTPPVCRYEMPWRSPCSRFTPLRVARLGVTNGSNRVVSGGQLHPAVAPRLAGTAASGASQRTGLASGKSQAPTPF